MAEFNCEARAETQEFMECLAGLCEGYRMEFTGSCALFWQLAQRPTITDISLRCDKGELIEVARRAFSKANMNPEQFDKYEEDSGYRVLRVTLASGLKLRISFVVCEDESLHRCDGSVQRASLDVTVADLCSDFSREFTLERMLAMYEAHGLLNRCQRPRMAIEYALAQYGKNRILRVMENYFKKDGEYVYDNIDMFRGIPAWLDSLECFQGWRSDYTLSEESVIRITHFACKMLQVKNVLALDTLSRLQFNDKVMQQLLLWIKDSGLNVTGIEPTLVGVKRQFLLRDLIIYQSGQWLPETKRKVEEYLADSGITATAIVDGASVYIDCRREDGQHCNVTLKLFDFGDRRNANLCHVHALQEAVAMDSAKGSSALPLTAGVVSFIADRLIKQIKEERSLYAFVMFMELYRRCRSKASLQDIHVNLLEFADIDQNILNDVFDPAQEDRKYFLVSFNIDSYMADYQEIRKFLASEQGSYKFSAAYPE